MIWRLWLALAGLGLFLYYEVWAAITKLALTYSQYVYRAPLWVLVALTVGLAYLLYHFWKGWLRRRRATVLREGDFV